MSRRRFKILRKTVLGLVLFILFLPVASLLMFQIPAIQTYAAKKAVEAVSAKIDGTIDVKRIAVVFFNRVMVYDATITGNGSASPWGDTLVFRNPGDTMAHIGKMSVTFSATDLIQGKLRADRVVLENGCFNLLKEDGGNNLKRIFRVKQKKEHNLPDFTIRDVRLNHFSMRLGMPFSHANVKPGCMNYKDVKITDICCRIENGGYKDKKIVGDIKSMSAKEECGVDLKSLTAQLSMGSTETVFTDFELIEGEETDIKASKITLSYGSPRCIPDWVDSVYMEAEFDHTLFGFNFLRIFTPRMKENHSQYWIDGYAHGTVKELNFENLTVATADNVTEVTLTGEMHGLPEIDTTVFDCDVSSLRTTLPGIFQAINGFTGKERPLPQFSYKLAKGMGLSYKGTVQGKISDLRSIGSIFIAGGAARHDITFRSKKEDEGSRLAGKIQLENINAGKILNVPALTEVDCNIAADVLLRDEGHGGMMAALDTCHFDKFTFKGYEYSGIDINVFLENRRIKASLASADTNFLMDTHGSLILPDKEGVMQLTLTTLAPRIDFAALNMAGNAQTSRMENLALKAGLSIKNKDDIFGKVFIGDISYTNDQGTGYMDSLTLKSHYNDGRYLVSLKSPYLSADYKGGTSILEMVSRLTDLIVLDQYGNILRMKSPKSSDTYFGAQSDSIPDHFRLDIKTVTPLCNLFAPKLHVAKGTSLEMYLSSMDSLSIDFKSRRVSYGTISADDISMNLSNPDSLIWSSFNSSNLTLGSFKVGDNTLDILSRDGKLNIMCLSPDENTDLGDMVFSSDISFRRDGRDSLVSEIRINPSNVRKDGERWLFSPSTICIGSQYISADHFNFEKDDHTEGLFIDGVISTDPESHIKVNLKNILLQHTFGEGAKFGGKFNGFLDLNDFYGKSNLLMDVTGDSVIVFGSDIGNLKLLSKWDPFNERLNLLAINKMKDKNPFNITGFYKPEDKYLFINASLEDLAVTYLKPLLVNVMDITGGTVSGDLSLSGPLNSLTLLSDNCQFTDVGFIPNYTKVHYTLNGGVRMTSRRIEFPDLHITDEKNNEGIISGQLDHNFFRDMNLSARLDCKNLACINLSEKDNPHFYGTASISGMLNIEGPFDGLNIVTLMETADNTFIHIPLSNSSSASKTDLLTFRSTDTVDVEENEYFVPKTHVEKESGNKKKSGITLLANATVRPDATIAVEIDRQLEDIITCKGSGTIGVSMNPKQEGVDLRGQYTITEGDIHYSIAAILPKIFTLTEGGTVNFNGPFSSTNLDLSATYHTKASVAALIADTSSTTSRQDVYCGVALNGRLLNPKISFSIDIPNLDPLTKSKVEAALTTEAKVQQQVLSLLATGSFIPTSQSGITNSSSILYSNFSEIVSNQINNIFRQLDVPLDMGVNYQQGQTKALVDLNVSYKAFNNRLVINGKVGNKQTSNNWGGDLEAEVKMDKKGKFRFSLFTRSPDSYTTYLDNTQRSGLGVSFQNEFNKFIEIFQSDKKKEALETKRILEAEEELRKSALQKSDR